MRNLSAIRRQRGLTQADVADLVGVATVTIINWEAGRQMCTQENLHKVARAFRVNPDWLMGVPRARKDIDVGTAGL
jgi:transcriptional regulator with XRE-family HTH domain